MVRRQAPPLALRQIGPLGDAQQRVVRLEHVRVGEEHVVGGDERQVVPEREVDEGRLDPLLLGQPVAHQLDVEAVRKHAGETGERRLRRGGLTLGQRARDGPGRPAGERQQALAERLDLRRGNLRALRPLGVEEGLAHQLEQVAVAGLVLDEKDELVRRRVLSVAGMTVVAAQVHPAADDRLHPGLGAGE